ncbi:cycloartenol synthase [Cavenderia fasciculata]|uniref:Cycloartenol synthase n=1 Tax=Cavenderia fasciculata TaxID=261658 RepID=F4Q022_CACFS|nr:cycloartenol synthase [Cavenderia fasciculata]EGG18936.1 cycloartenol synthase [Cavenderia fasciculata]|eukprot:XP_004357398.1 cycloartenol synthase [Cavenderia fasciculata]
MNHSFMTMIDYVITISSCIMHPGASKDMSWTLDVDRGRQTWRYVENPTEPNPVDVHLLSLKTPGTTCPEGCNLKPATSPQEAIKKSIDYFSQVQTKDGHWAGDYGGPMFLLPGLVITCYVTGYALPEPHQREIIRYLFNRQNPNDGGWGLHIEAHSDIFGTALQYTTLRILGVPADEPRVAKARAFLLANGGALGIPSWGKFWLAVLNVYKWEGLNPIPIELWLVPYKWPVCPGRWWCHCRMVYLPMSYLYARKTTCVETELIRELRKELYNEAYESISWADQRNNVSKLDMYNPHTTLLKTVNSALYLYEKYHSTWLRNKAIDFTFEHIRYEDEQTNYLDVSQVPEDAPEMDKYYRHISKGAWPFSTVDHGWPISDCTAEGVKAALSLRSLPFITPISLDRVAEGINVILSLQNKDGGWASYENTRTGPWIESFNPSEVFHNIMIDYSYVECSAACVQAMCKFLKFAPSHPRLKEINRSIERGVQFIKSIQRADGSWIGSWGICFTYGTWFGIEGLVAAGEPLSSPHIVKACKFLVSKQRPDGGWGESFKSNVTKEYVQHPDQSQIVNTGWALLSLMAAKYPDREPIERGIKFLLSKQYPNGDFPQESIIGVFNFNCMISYSNYKNIFPLWALGRYNNILSTLTALGNAITTDSENGNTASGSVGCNETGSSYLVSGDIQAHISRKDVFDNFVNPEDMPRYNFQRTKVSKEFDLKNSDYVESLIVLGLPGLILSIAFLFLGIIALFLRNCIHWGKKDPRLEILEGKGEDLIDTNSMAEFEHRPKRYKTPFCLRLVKFLLFFIILVTLAGVIIGLTSNAQVSKDINGFFIKIEDTSKLAKSVVNTIRTGLAGKTADASLVRKNMNAIGAAVEKAYQDAHKARVSESNLNSLRDTIITLSYIIAVLASAWGVFALVNGMSWSFMFLSYMSLLAIFVSYLSLGIHLPLSAASSDLCNSMSRYIETGATAPWMKTWLDCDPNNEEVTSAVAFAEAEATKLLDILNRFSSTYMNKTFNMNNLDTYDYQQLRAYIADPKDDMIFINKFDRTTGRLIQSVGKLRSIATCSYVKDTIVSIEHSYCSGLVSNINKIIFSEIIVGSIWILGFIFAVVYSKKFEQKDDDEEEAKKKVIADESSQPIEGSTEHLSYDVIGPFIKYLLSVSLSQTRPLADYNHCPSGKGNSDQLDSSSSSLSHSLVSFAFATWVLRIFF